MALVIAMVMVLAMGVTAFAEGGTTAPTTYSISVNTANNKATHTYKVYQIFTGTPSDGQLVDVRYGFSAGTLGTEGELVPGATLEAITDARAWVAANINSFGTEIATLDGTTTSYDAVPGWYVVLDTNYEYDADREQDDTDAFSAYMVEVVDEVTVINPKNDAPTVDKEVQDDETPEWGEAADHEIGETFQFKLTATLPADINYAVYETYPITFNDTMSDGVTFESIDKVIVDEIEIEDTGYTTTATAGQAGGSWTLTIADVKAITGIDLTDGTEVVVTYNAHLNTNAITHNDDATATVTNNNKVSLTYNNNPDATGTGNTDTTPEDYVWVFSYKSENTKVDADDEPLAGAGFTLKNAAGTAISLYKVGPQYYVYDENKSDYPAGGDVVTEMLTTEETNAFNIIGLDVGTYTLEETTIPTGYNKCDDITIEIEATHTENADLASADLTLTKKTNINNKVVNQSGAELPSTGGIGTTIFYVIGAILVIGAGVILVTRRRMSTK